MTLGLQEVVARGRRGRAAASFRIRPKVQAVPPSSPGRPIRLDVQGGMRPAALVGRLHIYLANFLR
jgi:hypothetical protein